jgi:hypothetical protein
MNHLNLVGVLAFLVVLTSNIRADEPAGKKPIGAWERKAGDTEVVFDFSADEMKVTISGADATSEVSCDYSVTKDGIVYGIIRKIDKKGGEGGPSEGDLFSFHYSMDNDTLTIKDLKGSNEHDEAKQLIQGEYKAKSKK